MQNERFRVNPAKVVHETIEGEAILIHLDNGFYYSLDGAGAEIWELLAGSRSFDEAAHELDAHYASDPETIAAEVRRLARELVGEDLLEATDEAPEVALNGDGAATKREFSAPVLMKYEDMQDFLLVDPFTRRATPGGRTPPMVDAGSRTRRRSWRSPGLTSTGTAWRASRVRTT